MDAKIKDMTFGVELELHLPPAQTHPRGDVTEAARRVSEAIGRPCPVEGLHHRNQGHWKVVPDGSIGYGWEFVSPPLKGDEGMAELETVLRVLNEFGATVGQDCGTHVHVGVTSNPDVEMLKRLVKGYAVYEPAIDSFMQPTRRGNRCNYCRGFSTIPLARIDGARSRHDLAIALGAGRFCKVNLTMSHGHPTVEFRQHGGTLEIGKLRYWILMLLRMVAAARENTFAVPTMEAAGAGSPQLNRARRGSKARIIGDLLLRPEGTTAAEVMRTVGWPSVSIPQQARLCGLRVTRHRMGRSVRYYARAAELSVVAGEATLTHLLDVLQVSVEERDYFTARAAHFAHRGGQRQAA